MAKNPCARLSLETLEERQVLSATIDLTGINFRTITGADNNAALPNQGAAETRQIRFGYGAQFPDGFGDAIITSPQRANPRTISNVLHNQTTSVPSARQVTDMVFHFGQFLTHDLDLTRNGAQWNTLSTGAVGDFRIPVLDPNDPLGPNPIPFNRSEFDPATGTPDPFPPANTRLNRREVINSVTSYIDGSVVYGSDPARQAALRTFQGGLLKTSAGNLLPFNTNNLPNDDPFNQGSRQFLAGDVRANEQVGLTALQTLFVREHNRLAGRIAQLNPTFNDEQIYQVARRLVGAQIQVITYEEYLPSILGFDLAPKPEDAVYNPATNATITNAFAHSAFRFGHSQISDTTLLVNNQNQTVGTLSIRDAFFNPGFLQANPNNLGLVLKGISTQVSQETDVFIANGVRNNLFGPPGAGGLDLASLDIQRGRDHGLPDYNTLRRNYGATSVTSFAEISSDPAIQAKLEQLFGNVNNIDSWTGALAEDHLPGSSAGLLVHRIVGNQFERLRDGDRFFYSQDPFLQTAGVRAVLNMSDVSLANIIRWNTNVTNLQDTVFFDRSVVIVDASRFTTANGSNISVVAAGGFLGIVNNQNGQVISFRALSQVSQVILVGSDAARDVFTLFMAGANGGIERGVVVTGGRSADDTLNIVGRLSMDTIIIGPRNLSINGNNAEYTGFERINVFTLGGNDNVQVLPGTLVDVQVFRLLDEWNGW